MRPDAHPYLAALVTWFVSALVAFCVSAPIAFADVPVDEQQAAALTSTEGEAEPVQTLFDTPRPTLRPQDAFDGGFAGLGSLQLAAASVNQDPEGDMPRQVAFSADGTECFIAHRDTDTVCVFEVATQSVVATIPTEDFPVDVAVTPNNQYAIVPNVFGNSVTVIDIATRTVAANIPITGTEPYRVAVSSDSSFAVVGVINDAVNSAISIIDLNTLTESATFGTVSQGAFGFFFTPEPGISGNIFTQFALASDDVTLVMPDRGGAQVVLYDVTTGSQIAALPTATLPTAVDISADGTTAVVSHEGNAATITVVDLTTSSIAAAHATGNNLSNQIIRITPDKNFAIAAILNNTIFVDLATGATTSTISTGTVGDIEISFDGQYAFVSNFNSRVIDIATQALVRTITAAACADSDASPTELRAVALNNRFREDIHLYDISGPAGFLEARLLSAEPEEGDAPRSVAVSPDGTTAVVVNNTSNNATILDLPSGNVRGYASTGERSLGVAITPDSTTAVVANFTSNTVSIIDLASATTIATLNVSQGPTEVAISPDGTMAFVTTVAGTDRLHFIQLAGAGSTVVGSFITGQMGSIGYTYGVFSGIDVSPDGSLVAVCVSFDDQLVLVDTATRTQVARIPVGDFPIRVAFSPDGTNAYVSHSFSDDLYEIAINGGASAVTATVGGIEFPLQVHVSADGGHVYVGSFDLQNPRIAIVDTTSDTLAATIPLSARPRSSVLAQPDALLYTTTTDGDLVAIDATGASGQIIDTIPLSSGPSDLGFAHAAHTIVVAQPIPDVADIVRLAPEYDCRRGNLNATNDVTADVVFVNSQSGGAIERRVTLAPSDPFTIDLTGPPSNEVGPAKFALYAWVGSPDASTVRTLPMSLGTSCMVMPPNSGAPQDDPKKIWNNIGATGFLGVPNLPSSPAPLQLISKPGGIGRTITAFVQGLMLDSAAPQGQAGVTNGVEILIQ